MRSEAYPTQDVPEREQLREQIRQSVRQQIQEQVRQARAQADQAREQARIAREQSHVTREAVRIVHEQRGMPHTLPGATIHVSPAHAIPPEAVHMTISFCVLATLIILGWPLMRAFGRRLAEPAVVTSAEPEIEARLTRIERAVLAVGTEVQRIAEGQRFTTQLFSRAAGEPALRSGSSSPQR